MRRPIRFAPALAALCALAPTAAAAQAMPGMDMPGHAAHPPAHPAPPPPHAHPASSAPQPAPQPEAMDHSAMDHSAMGHGAMPGMAPDATPVPATPAPPPPDDAAQLGTALPAGNRPAPPPPRDHYADRDYGAAAMAASRAALGPGHGGGTFSQLMLDAAELRVRNGRDGYHWDAEAWFGGDIHRLTLKSEGEGGFGEGVDHAEIQMLYSRALDAYWNLQAGVRHDIRPDPSRTYATLRVEGLAPYWFEVEAALFLSDKGDVLARLEASHDMRLTQRLVLQPRAAIDLSAQDMPAQHIGSGLTGAGLDLRLRYEVRREFAPYIGLSWQRRFGDTARFARAAGDGAASTSLVIGVRAWF